MSWKFYLPTKTKHISTIQLCGFIVLYTDNFWHNHHNFLGALLLTCFDFNRHNERDGLKSPASPLFAPLLVQAQTK